MNTTLYSIVGGILLAVAAFFYGQHVGTVVGDLKLSQEQNNEYESYLAYDKAIQTASGIAAADAQEKQLKFQADLAAANTRANAANATSSQLQHAFSLYADGGWFKSSPGNSAEGASSISVSDANARIGLLANDARTLDADGLADAKGLANCAVKLAACEGWAGTVQAEFGVKQ